jgi:hypothetical protein
MKSVRVPSTQLLRAEVLEIHDESYVVVRCERNGQLEHGCDLLHTSEQSNLLLAPGDTVLVWFPDAETERGVVLGRLGPSHAIPADPSPLPDDLVLEAQKTLTLKCGEASMTLREDGKVLTKGTDVVSHARRLNRVKGGAVSIN